jgi:hypothetical protein
MSVVLPCTVHRFRVLRARGGGSEKRIEKRALYVEHNSVAQTKKHAMGGACGKKTYAY